MRLGLEQNRAVLDRLQLRLRHAHPRQKLNESRQYAADLESRLRNLMSSRLELEKHRLALCVEKMKGLSPLEKLSQGYSYVQTPEGKNIRSVKQAQPGMKVDIYVKDGSFQAEVISVGKDS